jgi:hypothetical protein
MAMAGRELIRLPSQEGRRRRVYRPTHTVARERAARRPQRCATTMVFRRVLIPNELLMVDADPSVQVGQQQASRLRRRPFPVCSHFLAPLPTAQFEIGLAAPVSFEQREEHFVLPGPAHAEIVAQ